MLVLTNKLNNNVVKKLASCSDGLTFYIDGKEIAVAKKIPAFRSYNFCTVRR